MIGQAQIADWGSGQPGDDLLRAMVGLAEVAEGVGRGALGEALLIAFHFLAFSIVLTFSLCSSLSASEAIQRALLVFCVAMVFAVLTAFLLRFLLRLPIWRTGPIRAKRQPKIMSGFTAKRSR